MWELGGKRKWLQVQGRGQMNLSEPEQCHGIEHSATVGCSTSALSDLTATSHGCLLNICSVTTMTEELNFQFYLNITNLNSNNHMGLVAMILNSTVHLDTTRNSG